MKRTDHARTIGLQAVAARPYAIGGCGMSAAAGWRTPVMQHLNGFTVTSATRRLWKHTT